MTIYPERKILVMGFPRSGTQFFAHCLRTCFAWDVGHEHINHDGGVGFQFAKWDGRAPSLSAFRCVCHLVRHPCDVLPSASVNLSHIPGFDMSDVERAWTDWNVLCERRLVEAANVGVDVNRFKIENYESAIATIGRVFDVVPEPVPDVGGEHVNHRKETRRWRWETLRPTTQWFATRYGYSQ